jgi:hypothetical protein
MDLVAYLHPPTSSDFSLMVPIHPNIKSPANPPETIDIDKSQW